MQRLFLFFIAIFFSINLSAQIAVKSFRVLQSDQTARITDPVIDQNGEKCALIRMVATETGFEFEAGMLGIMKAVKKTGEYWVYVSHGSKRISILHNHLGVLRNYFYTEAIREATVYEMVLTTAKVSTIVEEIVIPTQWLIVSSSPEGANVYINEQHKGTTPFQMEMEEGHYTYRIEMPLYHPEAGAFDLKEADGKKRIETNLRPNFGFVNISSIPESGATIYVDGQIQPKTTPLTTGRLKSGNHNIRIEKNMFHPQDLEIVINDDQTTQAAIVLEPAFGGFQINTEPEQGAAVFLDGNPTGKTTPCTLERLSSGEHLIRAQKEWYQPKTERVNISEGQTSSIIMVLIPTFGTVNITASEGAFIYVDDERKTTGNWAGRLIAGWHTFEARKDKYHTASQKMEVILGQEQNLNLQPTAMQGILKIVSTPFDADIKLNGKNYDTTPNTIKELLIGDYNLVLSKAGYGTISKTISLKEDETIAINETLPSGIAVNINSSPSGASLSIDGTYAGTTPYTATLAFGQHQLKLINGKKTLNETINLSQNSQSTFQYDVNEFSGFTENVNGVSFEMVAVKGGIFQIDSKDGDDNENPGFLGVAGDFYIGKHEVTQKLWKALMGSNPSHFKGDKRPVEQVSWIDVQDFINKLNQKTGKLYRLPTEAEWEYAACGGSTESTTTYPGSSNIDNVAWYKKNSFDKGRSSPDYGTHIVGSKQANELGIFDMSGNVREWCRDLYRSYDSRRQIKKNLFLDGFKNVIRGGSWNVDSNYCRVAFRSGRDAKYRGDDVGFRLVLPCP
jgi:formylglycine-generating enzyme required for sulfatase activity